MEELQSNNGYGTFHLHHNLNQHDQLMDLPNLQRETFHNRRHHRQNTPHGSALQQRQVGGRREAGGQQ
eukprot:12930754-Prorocentrum_lima.AAC.1